MYMYIDLIELVDSESRDGPDSWLYMYTVYVFTKLYIKLNVQDINFTNSYH